MPVCFLLVSVQFDRFTAHSATFISLPSFSPFWFNTFRTQCFVDTVVVVGQFRYLSAFYMLVGAHLLAKRYAPYSTERR